MQVKKFGLASALASGLILAASSLAVAQTTEKKDLGWSFTKGDKFSYTMTWGLDLGQSLRGAQPMEMGASKVKVAYRLDQEVTAVEDGVATIKGTIKTIRASAMMQMMGMPGPEETYDSEKEGGEGILTCLSKAIDQEITFKMKSNGEVTEVTGGAEISTKLQAALREAAQKAMGGPNGGGGGMGGMGGAQAAAMTLLAFEDESIKSAMNLLNRVLPGDEKESWGIEHVQTTKFGIMKFKGKYKFGEAAAGKTRITFKNDGDIDLTKDANASGGPDLSSMIKDLKVVDSKLKGLATFGTGHILDSEVEFMADAEGEAAGMLKQRLQMMGGGGGGDLKLGLKYALTLRYERAKSKKSEF